MGGCQTGTGFAEWPTIPDTRVRSGGASCYEVVRASGKSLLHTTMGSAEPGGLGLCGLNRSAYLTTWGNLLLVRQMTPCDGNHRLTCVT